MTEGVEFRQVIDFLEFLMTNPFILLGEIIGGFLIVFWIVNKLLDRPGDLNRSKNYEDFGD